MTKILVVGPHPDDQELGMGGTIAKFAAEGHDVLLLDMTSGEPTPYGTPEQVAEQLAPYAEKGCRLFNLKVVTHDPADEVDLGAATKAHLEKLVG